VWNLWGVPADPQIPDSRVPEPKLHSP